MADQGPGRGRKPDRSLGSLSRGTAGSDSPDRRSTLHRTVRPRPVPSSTSASNLWQSCSTLPPLHCGSGLFSVPENSPSTRGRIKAAIEKRHWVGHRMQSDGLDNGVGQLSCPPTPRLLGADYAACCCSLLAACWAASAAISASRAWVASTACRLSVT
jgi:hypothetical protein